MSVSAAPKIRDLENLADQLASLRASGKRIVHCHGVFDLLHIGHLRHLKSAREFGDVLVVIQGGTIDKASPGRTVFVQRVVFRLGHLDIQTTQNLYGWVSEDAEQRTVAEWQKLTATWRTDELRR